MRTLWRFMQLASFALVLMSTGAHAQDEARAAWQVTNFDITVTGFSERALNARATVSVRNVGRGAGSTVSLRLNPKAEIKAASVAGATANFRSTTEPRVGAQRVTVTLPSSIAPNNLVSVTLEYRFPVEENTGVAAISPLGSQFLPSSLWYPQPSTPLMSHGADYAPFRLTVTGATAIASGVDKSTNGTDSVYEQSLNALPFFLTGGWDRVEGSGKGISAFLLKGAGADERKQAEALIALAADAQSFFGGLLGSIPDVPVRLIAVTRGSGVEDSGTVLLNPAVFRRAKIDAVTTMTIAESVARLQISGEAPVRGEGFGVIREGLVRFLATLFVEKEFGAESAEAERARERLAYVAIAKRDAPLSRATPPDETYFNSVSNKGAMVWRLVDRELGREGFLAALRASLQAAKNDPEGLTLARFRAAVVERGGVPMKNLLDQELDQATDMDLLVGLPRQDGGQWISALRNLGSIDATVDVVALTDSGERIVGKATIPAHDFGQVVFKTASKVVRVEVDPDKFYPQLDFANDVVPRSSNLSNPLGEATRLFGAQEYAKAEAIAREMLSATPRMQEARIVLARSLLGENKNDEAEREFRQLLDERLPSPAALAWANIGLGTIALRRGQAAEAARRFNDAVHDEGEYASTLAARAQRIQAESAANSAPPIDESAKAFISQLDSAIRAGRKADLDTMLAPGELVKFVKGVVGTQPEVWQTHLLRTEQLDASRLTADVELNTKQLGVEHSGTTVLVLTRVGGNWKLEAVELFEVR
jgi:tetratricopeptide (TPR) repeat protein